LIDVLIAKEKQDPQRAGSNVVIPLRGMATIQEKMGNFAE
jgi:hypothetical protein